MSVVAGPPAWAAPGAEPGLPHTRTAAARPLARPPTLPTPWRGGAFLDSKDTDGSNCGGDGAGSSGS